MKLHTKNIFSLLAGDVTVRVLGFIATVYLARVLGSESFGVINFGIAALSYGLLLSSPGLHIVGTKLISSKEGNEHLHVRRITTVRIVLATITCLCMYFFAQYFIFNEQLRAVSILFSFSLLPMAAHIEWYFQGKENITAVSAGKISWSLIYTAGILFLISSQSDFRIVPFLFFIAVSLQAFVLFFLYKNKSRDNQTTLSTVANESSIELLKKSLPLGSATITAQAFIGLPTILLGFFSTPSDIANFSIASKLVFFALAIDRIMFMLFFPFVTRLYSSSSETLRHYLSIIFKFIIIICLPITIGGAILAQPLLTLIFGTQYEGGTVLLQIQLWYFFFTILNSFFSYTLIAIGEEKYFSRITSLVLFAAMIAMVPMAYYFASRGVSVAIVLGECMLVLFVYKKILRNFKLQLVKTFIAPVISTVAMSCFLVIFYYIHVVILLPLAVIVYGAILFLLRGIHKEDLLFIKERFV